MDSYYEVVIVSTPRLQIKKYLYRASPDEIFLYQLLSVGKYCCMENMDAELVRRAKRGDKDAFGLLVDRHRDVVFSLCFSRCRNFTDAQDLAQEAFIRAYANLHQLREHNKFAPWLFRITCAVCARWFRDQKAVNLPFDEAIAIADDKAPVEEELLRQETRQLVTDALGLLPETQMLATTLHYLAGYSLEEIGYLTGTSESIIKARLKRARKRIRGQLTDKFAESMGLDTSGKGLTRRILSGIASFEKEETFSHIRALRAILEFHEERVDWDQLLATSGEAFCIYFSPNWSHLSRFVHSWDVLSAASAAYGYRGEWYFDNGFDIALDLIEQGLRAGSPVAAPGVNPASHEHGGSESHYWFVVNGIDRESKTLSLAGVGETDSTVSYPFKDIDGQRILGWRGIVRCFDVYPTFIAANPLFMISRSGEPTNARTLALDSLRRAVRLAYEKPVRVHDQHKAHFYGGIAALEQWSKALMQTVSQGLVVDDCNDWTNCCGYALVMQGTSRRLEVARRAAASYVHWLAGSDLGLSSDKLIQAANHYEAVASTANKLFEVFFDPEEESELKKAVSTHRKPDYFQCDAARDFYTTFTIRFAHDPERRAYGAQLTDEITVQERAAVNCLLAVVTEVANGRS